MEPFRHTFFPVLLLLSALLMASCRQGEQGGDLPYPQADAEVADSVRQGDAEKLEALLQSGVSPNSVAAVGERKIPLLCLAAESGRVRCVNVLLQNGAELSATDSDGATALCLASAHGKVKCTKRLMHAPERDALAEEAVTQGRSIQLYTLLHAGLNAPDCVCHVDGKELPAAHAAAVLGQVESLILLLRHGATLSDKDSDGRTVLELLLQHWLPAYTRLLQKDGLYDIVLGAVIREGKAEVLQQMLGDGLSPDSLCRDADSRTMPMLHMAVLHHRPDCAELLLKNGANVDLPDADGLRSLDRAMAAADFDSVQLLLQYGARSADVLDLIRFDSAVALKLAMRSAQHPDGTDPDARLSAAPGEPELPLIFHALARGSSACLRVLLEAGADVHVTDGAGQTALQLALRSGDDYCAELLIRAGAESGLLHEAAERGDAHVLALSLRGGVPVDCPSASGERALHLAVLHRHEDCIRLLLESGAEVNAPHPTGKTPLHLAAEQGYAAGLSLLIAAGAEVNRGTSTGITPLHLAARAGSLPCVERLLEAGADVNACTKAGEENQAQSALEWAAAGGRSACAIRLAETQMPLSDEKLIQLYSLSNRASSYQPAFSAWLQEHWSPDAKATYCANALQGGRAASVRISMAEQSLSLCNEEGEPVISFPCSTGSQGRGSCMDSGQTPTGRFLIYLRIGQEMPLNTIFKNYRVSGEWNGEPEGVEDLITTRMLYLDGVDVHNANTRYRQIYIHGTADTEHIGTPSSHGCIRMLPEDVALIFPYCPEGTPVFIEE